MGLLAGEVTGICGIGNVENGRLFRPGAVRKGTPPG